MDKNINLPNFNNLEDLSRLRINKVVNHFIKFNYKGTIYMIHESLENPEYKELYILDDSTEFKTFKLISSIRCCKSLKSFFFNKNMNDTIVYNQIDKNHFIFQLNKLGFCNSFYQSEIDQQNEIIDELKEKLKRLDNERNIIISLINSLY